MEEDRLIEEFEKMEEEENEDDDEENVQQQHHQEQEDEKEARDVTNMSVDCTGCIALDITGGEPLGGHLRTKSIWPSRKQQQGQKDWQELCLIRTRILSICALLVSLCAFWLSK